MHSAQLHPKEIDLTQARGQISITRVSWALFSPSHITYHILITSYVNIIAPLH